MCGERGSGVLWPPTFILEVAFLPAPDGNGGVHCLREERRKDEALGTGRGLCTGCVGGCHPWGGPGVLAPCGGWASMCVAREEREINVLTREVRLAFWLGYRGKKKSMSVGGQSHHIRSIDFWLEPSRRPLSPGGKGSMQGPRAAFSTLLCRGS